jgi:hypothetical protein
LATGWITLAVVLSASASDQGKVPRISARTYSSGSATVTVTGSFQVAADIPINRQASFSDGEMTWLQYGASGSQAPNALVTVNLYEIGINVGLGKQTTIVGADECTGSLDVTGNSISGHYKCRGAPSHDPRVLQLGNVNIDIRFTAGS